eukprot:TRINITY_DN30012_c0_g1_i1.p1 TRINITY_DN30012_c0_g1~~TRINITY_DN30012_c0_g1_i1.p1  ORF type:complete len:746 (+),score=145.37 TRINITY_DN30012_c0_g1_i1:130-2367(+)
MELASMCHVKVQDFPETGRGLGATKDLKEGDVMLEIPLKYCWTPSRARAIPELQSLSSSSELSDKDMLFLHLMIEASKGGSEPWISSHLKELPTLEEVGLPLSWSEEERAELEGSEAHTHCSNLDEELPEDFAKFQAALKAAGAESLLSEHKLGYKEYLWARCMFWSRTMSLSVDGEADSVFALVPGLDMCNHSPDAPAGLFRLDNDGSMVVARAAKDYTEGEQVFINYKAGAFNDQLLLSFGFTLPRPELHSSEITFSLNVTSQQMAVHRQLLENPSFGFGTPGAAAHEVVHMPSPSDFESQPVAELIVKHRLTLDNPVPVVLLGMTRIQHLPPSGLQDPLRTASAVNGKRSSVGSEEFRVLFLLEDLLRGKLSQLPSSEEEDDALLGGGAKLPLRRRFAIILRRGEREVLRSSLRRLESQQLEQLRLAVIEPMLSAGPGSNDERCIAAKTPRLHVLQAADMSLQAAEQQVARLSQALFQRLPAKELMKVASATHLWIVGKSTSSIDAMDAVAEDSENDYLELYKEKMTLWGSWFCSQWAHANAVRLEEFSCIGQEQASLRNKHACSIPNSKALSILAASAPLLEVGAGSGYWARLLQSRGVDILAFDTATFEPAYNGKTDIPSGKELIEDGEGRRNTVKPGGPEVVVQHPERTLVLMWADIEGFGTYGLQCLEGYQGDSLILVGEWKTSTYGAYTTGMSEHGRSFSKEFQESVEERFELVESVSLPNWPLALDRLALFKRKKN